LSKVQKLSSKCWIAAFTASFFFSSVKNHHFCIFSKLPSGAHSFLSIHNHTLLLKILFNHFSINHSAVVFTAFHVHTGSDISSITSHVASIASGIIFLPITTHAFHASHNVQGNSTHSVFLSFQNCDILFHALTQISSHDISWSVSTINHF